MGVSTAGMTPGGPDDDMLLNQPIFVKKLSVDILAKQASDMASEHIDAIQREMDIEKL